MMHRRVSHATAQEKTVSSALTPTLRRRRKRHTRRPLDNCLQTALALTAVILLAILGCMLLAQLFRLIFHPHKSIHELKPHRGDVVQDLEVLPFHPLYRIPEAMPQVGDRSGHYAKLRKETDEYLSDPATVEKHFQSVISSQAHQYQTRLLEAHNSDQIPYDIHNCPDTPPPNYPFSWKTLDIITKWPTDSTQAPINAATGQSMIHQSLCVFDYTKDYEKAVTYRDASLPFIVINDPQVQETVVRWSLPGYMDRLLGAVPHRTEYSPNNHFMYYIPPPKEPKRHRGLTRGLNQRQRQRHSKAVPKVDVPEGWTAPTEMLRMSYAEWLEHANVSATLTTRDDPHWYFRLIGCGAMGNDGSCDFGSSEYLFDELPYFQPKTSLYVVQPEEQKGIHCRFGMRGVIAENHFDGSRNAIVVLGGSRRYILSHPDQCANLALHPKGHPSARHSAVDWSHPDLETFPEFAQATSSEVVLQPGHILYLPTNWFHYIVSLELNFQCNTRSGTEQNLMPYVEACGF